MRSAGCRRRRYSTPCGVIIAGRRLVKEAVSSTNIILESSMNRAEMIDAMSEQLDMSRKDATAAINAVFHPVDGMIAKAMKKGDKVSITGFGTVNVRKRAARKARNPQTGESIRVGASKAPGFKAGQSLKATVNGKSATRAAKPAKKAARKAAKKTAKKARRR